MKIAILEPLGIAGEMLENMLQEAVGGQAEVIYYNTRKEDEKTLIERSKDADAVVLSNFRYSAEVMKHCPKLKYICVAFTGYDHVDMAYCREHQIQVSNCAGYSTAAVADLVFAFVLALCRRLIAGNEAVRRGGTKAGLVGPELEGKKFGVIGAGAIGMRTARIAQAFGCEVYLHSRTPKTEPGMHFIDLETLMKECDIISIHLPQNQDTVGMVDQKLIGLMKKSALFINTARGPIVDSRALADALNSGAIAGAGIDVFETEPPIAQEHPLLTAKNCICTPHIAFATDEAMVKRARIVCANLQAYLDGGPVNLV